MRLRLYNARILTMEKDKDVFFGEIWVSEGTIVRIINYDKDGCDSILSDILFDREIDCEKNLLMPGFKNAHTHSAMCFLRSHADDLPLNEWLNEKIFPNEAKLLENDIAELVRLSILEYLSGGVTSIFDMYLKPDECAKTCAEMGMRAVIVSGLNNFTSSVKQMEEEYVRLNSFNPLISYKLGFHAEYTTSKELIGEVAALSHRLKAPVYMHLSETEKEVLECRKRYGLSPVCFLDSMGVFNYGGGGFHCIHLDERDISIFKMKNLNVVTNPSSNIKLASGICPISKYMKAGINIAIGTDGPASNNCLDMFREMFLVSGLTKVNEHDATKAKAMDVLRMATVGGAKCMGLTDCMYISEGQKADIIMIDLNKPNMQPINNIPVNIVYSGSKSNVRMTMIDGKILYMDGEYFLPVSEKEIYERCTAISRRILTN